LLSQIELSSGQEQQRVYKPISTYQIQIGYGPNDELVEVKGYVTFSERFISLTNDPRSAAAPILIDAASLPVENRQRLQEKCHSSDQFSGGCWVTIQGQTTKRNNRQWIIATEVELLSEPPDDN